mmetsp:Transcript_49702/g.128214  ORF Transcript_49702/g.128214 Transcript_49702/m.128214 type:complete len:207 (+) Transcript_49702:34-654(+)
MQPLPSLAGCRSIRALHAQAPWQASRGSEEVLHRPAPITGSAGGVPGAASRGGPLHRLHGRRRPGAHRVKRPHRGECTRNLAQGCLRGAPAAGRRGLAAGRDAFSEDVGHRGMRHGERSMHPPPHVLGEAAEVPPHHRLRRHPGDSRRRLQRDLGSLGLRHRAGGRGLLVSNGRDLGSLGLRRHAGSCELLVVSGQDLGGLGLLGL